MTSPLALSVRNLSKQFLIPEKKYDSLFERIIHLGHTTSVRKFQVLDDVSFELKRGEFLGMIGANGSGKSTLLKIIADIYKPNKGQIDVYGNLVPFLELGVGFNPELTGRENIFLNAIILGMTQVEVQKKFNQIVEFSELREFLDLKLKNYSSGMQVRLAFAIAIHVDAEIYILDEVLAVGDFHFQKKCLDVFNGLRSKGVSVIFVSHSMEQIKTFCDRAVVLVNGKLHSFKTVEAATNFYLNQ